MAKARKVKNLVFTLPNKVGLLSEVSSTLAQAKVNINAICAYEMEDKAIFMLAADSNVRATKALAPLGAEIKEEEVVAVDMPNRPGELEKVAKKLAEAGININLIYGTTGSGKTSTCFFKTADNKKAIRLINK
jgi:hypothetical protein